MRVVTLALVTLMLTGCNSPGVLKPPPFPESQLYKCPDGHYKAKNPFKQVDPCLE